MSKRILIVEDELDLRSTLEFKFKSEGYTVNAVSKGKDAIDAIARKKPDLILLDLMLPDMSGLDICLLYTSPSPRDMRRSRMPSSA